MYLEATSLDDLLHRVFDLLFQQGTQIEASRGPCTELIGVLLKLSKPRARISTTETRGKVFSSLGELAWYLSGSNKLAFIKHYVEAYVKESQDGVTIPGAYGPRMFGSGNEAQIENIVKLLKSKPSSRRAVIQLYDRRDLVLSTQAAVENKSASEVPCTCTLQFFVRNGQLDLLASMRSNDAYLGLPHDVFCFTMIQEIVARALGRELGCYMHSIGSLHIYEPAYKSAKDYLSEGWQRLEEMMPMEAGDQRENIAWFLSQESAIREGEFNPADPEGGTPFWTDLIRLLNIYKSTKLEDSASAISFMQSQREKMGSDIFDIHIEEKAQFLHDKMKEKQKPAEAI